MKYDPQKHHRRSIRLNGYDYSQAGAYFVTIVTPQRACLFGEIVDGRMRLKAAGRIVQWEWWRLGQRFPNVQLDAFVVMPNHVHGIIVIRTDTVGETRLGQKGYSSGKDSSPDEASEGNDGSPLRDGNDGSPVPNGPGPGSLGAIIGQFKSRVSKRIWAQPGMYAISVWQRNCCEHIIRDAGDYCRVQGYILSNPVIGTMMMKI